MQEFDRITINPEIMGGRPCIRGLRFPISRILSMLAARETEEDILANHPDLEAEDIQQAMSYAARIADDEVVILRMR